MHLGRVEKGENRVYRKCTAQASEHQMSAGSRGQEGKETLVWVGSAGCEGGGGGGPAPPPGRGKASGWSVDGALMLSVSAVRSEGMGGGGVE